MQRHFDQKLKCLDFRFNLTTIANEVQKSSVAESALCDAFPQGVGGIKLQNAETHGAIVHTNIKSKALDVH